MKAHADPAVQLLLDRAAVRDVILRYARGIDRRDFDAVRDCFRPDVEGDFGGEWRSDRDSLIEFISGVAYFHTTMHMMGNSFVEVSGDEASLQSYGMLAHHGTNDDGGEWQYNNSVARYSEDLVRSDEGWAIQRRGAQPVWAAVGATEVASDDPAVSWLLGRARIYDVAMQYALGVDLREYERVGNCFAKSFRARYGEQEFDAIEPLIAFIRGVEYFESTTHFLGTPVIELGADAAQVETLAYITHRQVREGKRPGERMSGGSVYRDRWLETEAGWRIAERRLGGGEPELTVPPKPVPESDDPDVQGLLDRAEISDLVSRTALALDRRDFAGLSTCFTSRTPAYVADQRTALGAWERTGHLVGNHQVVFHEGGARSVTYVYRTEHVSAEDPASHWSNGALRWEDELERTADGWRITDRKVASNRVREPV